MPSCRTAHKTMETSHLSLNLEIRYVVVLTFNLDSHGNISNVCLYIYYVTVGWKQTMVMDFSSYCVTAISGASDTCIHLVSCTLSFSLNTCN